ncbi:Pkinase-domain-containing protein [Trametes coccinea BRFM310]|uniref:Pkinase-domain-containing protein n=1 Tax=Trametes coccinea (strain BRFM310) TaxID=1353009 RepID=A0A1Y2ILE9_TRAC3|nr:Pkinase-domain-containing protein [Trametes coccinea BRFM310]
MSTAHSSPPRAPRVKYATPLGTRWEKEKAAAGSNAFEYPDDAKYVGPWIMGECVGKGASGRVKIARHRRTGQLAAVKILPLQPFLTSRNAANAQAKAEKHSLGVDREIIMMKLMDHPNIMRIFDVYEGEKELYLILEYVEGGELFDFLVNRGRLPPLEALAYFKQIVYGLNYAHTFSIIHRDLKPENILIHSLNPPLIKIADWGMAAFAPPTLQLETSCGSPHYASPEIVNGHKYTGTATDIWSCGVILYALLTGRLPFDDKNVRTLLTKVKVGKYDMPSFIDPLAKDLLSRMLVVDVHKRISMSEILAHPWLEGVTPGITYVLAPPVSELAQPLPSALHIDRDIFESLCVIWGRHADPEGIRSDLLSPAGQGTLAKAFYFLLQKHREKAMEEHGILMDIDGVLNTHGKIITKQYAAPRSKAGHRQSLEITRPAAPAPQMLNLRSDRPAPLPPSRTPSPKPLTVNTSVAVERAPSRPHPPSPVGPRPQKPKPQRSSVGTAPASHRTSLHGPSYVPRVTGHTGVSAPGVIYAPRPVVAPTSSVLTTPRSADVEMQSAETQPLTATAANAAALPWPPAHMQSVQPASRMSRPVPPADDVLSRRQTRMNSSEHRMEITWDKEVGNENKENADRQAPGRTSHSDCPSGGLGFGHSVPMAKEMGNMVFLQEASNGQQVKKDKKARPPPLDFSGPPALQKRSTFSITSPHISSPQSTTMSPAVGEFKGWFSNLFHWKPQSYLLYSVLDLGTTRSETIRLLEHFGAIVSMEENGGWSVLRCRIEDVHDSHGVVQKQVRFRVEFTSCSAGSSHTSGSYPSSTPRLSQGSQVSFSGRSRVENLSGYETVLGFVLEKGSVSAFKTLYHRLRAEWRLDALLSPTTAGASGVPMQGIQQQFMA